VRKLCELIGVSTSGFYAWMNREPSNREKRDDELKIKIKEIHDRSRGTYGAPRIFAELKFLGEHVARKRVQRLMKRTQTSGS
jgi:putative transposase